MDDILRKRRSKDQKEVDITKIAPLYLKGLNYREISEQLGLSIKQVSSDILSIKEEWRKAYIDDFNEFRKRELLKIDLIEAEAWKAWEKSKRGRTSTLKSAEDSQQFGARKSASEEHSGSHGDVQYLQLVQSCVNNRLKLLGAYGAAKIENPESDVDSDSNKFSRDEVLNLIDSIAGRVVVATQSPANLLEAMRSSAPADNSDVIDAQYTDITTEQQQKQLTPAQDIEPTPTTAAVYDAPPANVDSKIGESSSTINGNISNTNSQQSPHSTNEEVAEDSHIEERSHLLDLMKSRKIEKSPDPRYEIPRTRKDDIRTIIRDLDSTRISSDIYNERVGELDSGSFKDSPTNRAISNKNKITK